MSNKKLKIFVWEGKNVLEDYAPGMICVLAHDYEEAISLIQKKCPYCMDSFPHEQYVVVEKPEAFICYGGGG